MSQKFPEFVASISSFLQEYLTSSMAVPSYQVISHEAHADVARMCVRYVSAILKEQSTHGEVPLLESFPMLSYVLSSGFNHIPTSIQAQQSFSKHWNVLDQMFVIIHHTGIACASYAMGISDGLTLHGRCRDTTWYSTC